MNRPAQHLLTVWNPKYASDAMDDHLRLLIDWADRWHRGEAEAEDVYVWWAKLRSAHRPTPLPHYHDILRIQAQVEADVETHLYLTDYRSLYVGHVDEITADAVTAEHEEELVHAPAYYRERAPELWFKLLDVRRLVSDDTPAVIDELGRLRNTRYHDQPVSLYGGMVELPLIVTREHETPWFGDQDQLTDGRLWAERDADLKGEVARIARELRENLLGDEVWAVLESASRNFLTSGDAVFRMHREDPAFDFSPIAVEYAKAVETELNALIFPAVEHVLARAPTSQRQTHVEGRMLDFGRGVAHQSLGTLVNLLERDTVLQRGIRQAFPHDHRWIEGELPAHLAPIVALRNPAAHSRALSRADVRRLRENVLGIGCEGLLVKLAGVKRRTA